MRSRWVEEEEKEIEVERWRVSARIMFVLSCCLICSLSIIQIRVADPGCVIKLRHTLG